MQSTLSASDGISVLHDGSSNHMAGGLAGSVLSGLLLAAAAYAAAVQVRSWLERQGNWQARIVNVLPAPLLGLLGAAPQSDSHFGDGLGEEMDTLWNMPAEPASACDACRPPIKRPPCSGARARRGPQANAGSAIGTRHLLSRRWHGRDPQGDPSPPRRGGRRHPGAAQSAIAGARGAATQGAGDPCSCRARCVHGCAAY